MANATLTTAGLVATTPRYINTADGLHIVSFRLASSTMITNKTSGNTTYGETNWYTITAFGQLALNAKDSIGKGDRVIISGQIKVRDWDNGERSGTSVEITADNIGHDLVWGTSVFTRVLPTITTETEPHEKLDLTTEPIDETE